MATLLFADEDFSHRVVGFLRAFGHDVLTIQMVGHDNIGLPDHEVLEFAAFLERAILTFNWKDFERLHWMDDQHAGIIVCSQLIRPKQLAQKIHKAIQFETTLAGKLIAVG